MPSSNDNSCFADERYAEFLRLFTAHQKWILGHLYHILHNYHDAEDVFQKTSVVLWQKFDEFESGTSFRAWAWACRVAFYQAKNFMRTAARDRHVFNDQLMELLLDERLEADAEIAQRRDALAACVEGLKPADRDLLRAIYESGDPVRDVAEGLGKAVQTVYNRLSTIRRRLHGCISARLAASGQEAMR
jgi:RNA polymerase sigma-70 factor, ECF subfamily